MITILLISIVVCGTCFAWLHYRLRTAPRLILIDKAERIQVLICRSKLLRDQLDAVTREFVELHGAQTDYEVDELTDCILHDVNYEVVMKRIERERI